MAKRYNLKEAKALLDGADVRCKDSVDPFRSAATYVIRHMTERGFDIYEDAYDFSNWEEFYGWFYSNRYVSAAKQDQ